MNRVQFNGIKRTDVGLLRAFSQYIQSAQSVDQTLERVHDVTQHLNALCLFKSIRATVDKDEVRFDVEEVPRIHAVTGTQIGSGEGSLVHSFCFVWSFPFCLYMPSDRVNQTAVSVWDW